MSCYYTSKAFNFGWANDERSDEVCDSFNQGLKAILESNEGVKHVFMTKQVHGSDIASLDTVENLRVIRREDLPLALKKWNHDESFLLDGYDGMITSQKMSVMISFYADCTPIALYDPITGVAGMAHSGWQGTVAEIGKKLVYEMVEKYHVDPKSLYAFIGPTAKKCCYEVDEALRSKFIAAGLQFDLFAIQTGTEKYHLDMADMNRYILIQAGVLDCHIQGGNHCTICESSEWHSFRRDGISAGRAALILSLD